MDERAWPRSAGLRSGVRPVAGNRRTDSRLSRPASRDGPPAGRRARPRPAAYGAPRPPAETVLDGGADERVGHSPPGNRSPKTASLALPQVPMDVFAVVSLPGMIAVVAAIALVLEQFVVFRARLPDLRAFLTLGNVIWLMVALAAVKVLHELGHALTCKHFGGDCHEVGVLLLFFTPCLYCNVSDAWLFPGKWSRIAVSAAGIAVEVFLAAIATFLWWFSTRGGRAGTERFARLYAALARPQRQIRAGHRWHRLLRQAFRADGPRTLQAAPSYHLLARRAQAIRDGAGLLDGAASVHALLHRRCARSRPSRDGDARRRLRDPRRRDEAGSDRRIQSVRMHPHQYLRRRECGLCRASAQRAQGHCAVDRQGRQPGQSLWRLQARLRQDLRRREQSGGRRWNALRRRALWQCRGLARLGRALLPRSWWTTAQPNCRSPIRG